MKITKGKTVGEKTRNCVPAFFSFVLIVFSANAYTQTDALRIKLARGIYSDETIIRFLPDATEGFDGSYDAWKLFSSNVSVPNMYTKISSGDELTINSIPSFTASITMDVFLKIGTAATYTISAEEPGAFSAGVKIIMKDLVTNQLYDLRTSNTYTFSLPVIAQTAASRFQVFFSYPASTQVVNATCSNCADGIVAVTKAGETNWQYQVTDTAGNPVATGTATGCTQNILGLASGNYTVAIAGIFSCTEEQPVLVQVTPVLLGASFVEFTAVHEGISIRFFWSTGMERNTDYFTLERSEHGINYAGVSTIAASGNSSTLHTYRTSDNDPSPGDSYYRVKLTDLDGDISYSQAILVSGNSTESLSVFPNPASDRINLALDGHKDSEVVIVIRDLAGREVMIVKTVPATNRENVAIDIPSVLVHGIYMITAIGTGQIEEQKVIIN